MTSEPILLKKKKLKRELVRGHTITDISALISFRNCRGQIPHCTDVETESPRRHCKPRWASISYPVRHFSIIVPSSPTHGFTFHGFQLSIQPWSEVIKWKITKINNS